MYPDTSKDGAAFEIWYNKIILFNDIANISINDHLEEITTTEEKEKGYDLADILPYYIDEKYKNEYLEIYGKTKN